MYRIKQLYLLLFYGVCALQTTHAQSIAGAEYFFDTDPGVGSGTTLTVNTNTGTLDQIVTIPTMGLSSGFHRVYIRVQDNEGDWSAYDSATFYVNSLDNVSNTGGTSIVAAEYFFDTDPGVGNGTAIAVNPNNPLEETFAIPTTGIASGFHRVYIRVQDDDGDWSAYDSATFYVNSLDNVSNTGGINIVAAEYFFNTDPGVGNGTAIAVNPSSPLEETFAIPTTGLTSGFHRVYIRVQDDDGDWSAYDSATFYVNDSPTNTGGTTIVAAEYFFDTDPGFGQGTSVPLVSTGTPDGFSIIIDESIFDCTEPHVFFIRVQDDQGTWSLYDFREDFTEGDTFPPDIAITTELTLQLDENNTAVLEMSSLNNMTTDDCSGVDVDAFELSQTNFTCDDIGTVQVTFSATDLAGNTSEEIINLTIEDTSVPVLVTQDASLSLNSNGTLTLDPNELVATLEDNCLAGVVLTASQVDFTCDDIGTIALVITATDASGNSVDETAMLTIVDDLAPSVSTQNQTVVLDENGMATLTVEDMVSSSSDNCAASITLTASQTTFSCTDTGVNTVTVTAVDAAGNTSESDVQITVTDDLAPTFTTQDLSISLDENGMIVLTVEDMVASSEDNCADALTFTASQTTFTCDSIGENEITITVTDPSGNSAEATATLTVIDDMAPSVTTQATEVVLDTNGTVTITAEDLIASSNDNCASTITFTVSQATFNCDSIGENTLIVTAEDSSGNISEEEVLVTVVDDLAPSVTTQDQTIVLDENGMATLTVEDMVSSSSDNCAASITLTASQTTFSCTDAGVNTVTVTAVDAAGNTSESDVLITVTDDLAPTFTTQDLSISLDENGTAALTVEDMVASSEDNCADALTFTASQTTFTCDSIGENALTITVTDPSGNSAEATATLTIVDDMSPLIVDCPIENLEEFVELGESFEIPDYSTILNSTDNCDIQEVNQEPAAGTALAVGTTTQAVTMEIVDGSGNVAMCEFTIAITEGILSVSDVDFGSQISLFPVPSVDFVTIRSDRPVTRVEVIDLKGSMIKTVESQNVTQVETANLAVGTYFLKLFAKDAVTVKRIIKSTN